MNRTGLDASLLHVEQEDRDALLATTLRPGPRQQEAPLSHACIRGPDLLPVDDASRPRLRLAAVRRAGRSEPAPGSEKPWHQMTSPAAIGGRNASCWAFVPCRMMTGPTQLMPMYWAPRGSCAAHISSRSAVCSHDEAPPPPNAVGQARARRRCRPSAWQNSSATFRSFGSSVNAPRKPSGIISSTSPRTFDRRPRISADSCSRACFLHSNDARRYHSIFNTLKGQAGTVRPAGRRPRRPACGHARIVGLCRLQVGGGRDRCRCLSPLCETRDMPDEPAEVVRILIVDDHEVVREGLSSVLASDPRYEVVGTAANGAAAVEVAAHTRPDVAIVDFRLPDMAGDQVCRNLLRSRPDLRVIMLSSYLNEGLVRQALDRRGGRLPHEGVRTRSSPLDSRRRGARTQPSRAPRRAPDRPSTTPTDVEAGRQGTTNSAAAGRA